jgi:stearoyl-CoA desaturase (Delta-9 desaturase)
VVDHRAGYQNFENSAYNWRMLAWVSGGESLHNNHHAYPRSPKFSIRRAEFDPSWLVIRILAAMRLLVIVKPPVALTRVPELSGVPRTRVPTRAPG